MPAMMTENAMALGRRTRVSTLHLSVAITVPGTLRVVTLAIAAGVTGRTPAGIAVTKANHIVATDA